MSSDLDLGTFIGTKMGEKSDFEKSLGLDDKQETELEPAVLTPTENAEFELFENTDESSEEVIKTIETEAPVSIDQSTIVQDVSTPEIIAKAEVEAKLENISSNDEPSETVNNPAVVSGGITSDQYGETMRDYKVGDIIKGRVVSTGRNILMDIDYKSEGIIEAEEISPGDKIKLGDEISVCILKLENKEGHPVLSKRLADYELAWQECYESFKKKENLDAKIISAVKGGLVVEYRGLRGFAPASQVVKGPGDELESFIGKELNFRVIEIDRRRKKIVFSNKLATVIEDPEATKAAMLKVEAGQVLSGTVSSIKKFGVFVDVGGIEGLVHISELSWKRVDDPSTVVAVGDKVDVFVLGVDMDKKKISLGMKQLLADPWVGIEERYKAGQLVTGTVVRLTSFGAFVELESGIEGLIHISELSNNRVERAEEIVKRNDKVQVKILRVDSQSQRIGLSLKDAAPTDAAKEFSQYKEENAKTRKEVTIADLMESSEAS